MTTSIMASINDIWQAADPQGEARRAQSNLSYGGRERLSYILRFLQYRSADRNLDSSMLDIDSKDPLDLTFDQEASLLIVLTLAFHHSDSLLEIPPELRKKKIKGWSVDTGYSFEVIMEACKLGPQRLEPLLGSV